jgi:hypothetical protein
VIQMRSFRPNECNSYQSSIHLCSPSGVIAYIVCSFCSHRIFGMRARVLSWSQGGHTDLALLQSQSQTLAIKHQTET